MTIDVNVLLGEWQLFTGSHANTSLHDVYSSDHFRHWVLYLHAGIHFQHVEVLMAIHQEFHGGRAGILSFANQCRRAFANAITLLGVHARSWSLFNELLVAALAGAIALVEMNGVAVLVANGLHFKVPGVLQELLHVHAAVTKCCGRFLPGCFNSGA